MEKPKAGQQVYIQTMMSICHGEDDMDGGLATIESVEENISGGHPTYFVSLKDIDRGSFNYSWIMENQEKWAQEYAGQIAKMNPDYTDTSGDPDCD